MKTRIITGIMIVALVALSAGVAAAQYGHGGGNGSLYVDADGNGICDNIGTYPRFADADGDGVCDYFGINGRDDDGDGIPNGQDDDYERPQDGNRQSKGCNR